MSGSLGLITIARALDDAEKYVNEGALDWQTVNVLQARMMDLYPSLVCAFPFVPTLQGWARATAEELNQILAEHGASIRLEHWDPSPDIFGVASINDFSVQWLVAGETEYHGLPVTIKSKPAFRLPAGEANVSFLQSRQHSELIIQIPTQNGDTVYITKYAAALRSGFEVFDAVDRVRKNLAKANVWHAGVRIPMVKMQMAIDISWLINLWAPVGTQSLRIFQALQEIKFGMNQFGARVVEITAIAMVRESAPPRDYEVDDDFLVWIERNGVPIPIFAAHITREHWKNPGDLKDL